MDEPVWPNGKAIGRWKADLGSNLLRLFFLFKSCGPCGHCLVTLSLTRQFCVFQTVDQTSTCDLTTRVSPYYLSFAADRGLTV